MELRSDALFNSPPPTSQVDGQRQTLKRVGVGVTEMEARRKILAEERTGQLIVLAPQLGYIPLSVLYERTQTSESGQAVAETEDAGLPIETLALFEIDEVTSSDASEPLND